MEISEALRAAIRKNSVKFLQPKSGMVILTSKLSDSLLDEIRDWSENTFVGSPAYNYKIEIHTVLNSYYGLFPIEIAWEQRTAIFLYDFSVNHSEDSI